MTTLTAWSSNLVLASALLLLLSCPPAWPGFWMSCATSASAVASFSSSRAHTGLGPLASLCCRSHTPLSQPLSHIHTSAQQQQLNYPVPDFYFQLRYDTALADLQQRKHEEAAAAAAAAATKVVAGRACSQLVESTLRRTAMVSWRPCAAT